MLPVQHCNLDSLIHHHHHYHHHHLPCQVLQPPRSPSVLQSWTHAVLLAARCRHDSYPLTSRLAAASVFVASCRPMFALPKPDTQERPARCAHGGCTQLTARAPCGSVGSSQVNFHILLCCAEYVIRAVLICQSLFCLPACPSAKFGCLGWLGASSWRLAVAPFRQANFIQGLVMATAPSHIPIVEPAQPAQQRELHCYTNNNNQRANVPWAQSGCGTWREGNSPMQSHGSTRTKTNPIAFLLIQTSLE